MATRQPGGGRKPGVMRPCGWCGVEFTVSADRKHISVCPKRPPQIRAAQKRLKEFAEREAGK